MKVIWSPEALADLEAISLYIRTDNPERARSFVMEIVDAGDALADMPRAFPLTRGLEHRGIRKRVHRRYLIFYRIEDAGDGREHVQVLHVAHPAQDYIRSLFGLT